MDEEGRIEEEEGQDGEDEAIWKAELDALVIFAVEVDSYRLIDLIMTMNSTIRHFKAANTLFFALLALKKIKGVM